MAAYKNAFSKDKYRNSVGEALASLKRVTAL